MALVRLEKQGLPEYVEYQVIPDNKAVQEIKVFQEQLVQPVQLVLSVQSALLDLPVLKVLLDRWEYRDFRDLWD